MSDRICPNCYRVVTGHPNKKFCSSRCKDRYHNALDSRQYVASQALDPDDYWYGPDYYISHNDPRDLNDGYYDENG